MARIHVGVLGPATFHRDDREIRLTPFTVKLLLRLVAAEGERVSARELYHDLWGAPVGRFGRVHRTEVQKRVLELRRAIEPGQQAEPSAVLRTEQLLNGREPESAYRLVLDGDQLDCREFEDLVNRAAHAAPATAVVLLSRALALWRGGPLPELSEAEFAAPLAHRLTATHRAARQALVRAYTELSHPDLALPLAERLAAEDPGDADAAETLRGLRETLRARHGDEVFRREFPRLRVTVVVKHGDLFAQDDANLVAGFGDTFDTTTDHDFVISKESVQGQLLERLFRGDRELLDKELRRGLRQVTPVGRETVQDKPRGKRTRYPIGTVVPIPLPGRRVFAVAYCHQGNDYVTRSTADDLRLGLERLWASVMVHGLLKPVAIPLVGSKLARITELDWEQLMIMIIDTFVASCRDRTVTPELRIVIRPGDLARIRLSVVADHLNSLDEDGRPAHA
ncbi:hypothetical protein Ssi03_69140 [Sphaerisporangium siamense]|uniref:DNA-binding SARP family transcriptional activator n=1 Tax=Sphaerisporangium siamense TaxID=795645 RepID=A0A7W7D5M3_9ACTN|nr:macro domain-containing protein [Sphaerisporangium siamense]MBB4700546.1 DNA-binding SARP family transcriptional activator [Sphaerisporangium siamense]GII88924.1 hypothetical protein Ssi03_69140 [Sphaerisporangium siamense]